MIVVVVVVVVIFRVVSVDCGGLYAIASARSSERRLVFERKNERIFLIFFMDRLSLIHFSFHQFQSFVIINQKGVDPLIHEENATIIKKLYQQVDVPNEPLEPVVMQSSAEEEYDSSEQYHEPEEIIEESLSLEEREKELIIKALTKHRGKRKYAAEELGISERTLYRKIKEYDLN